MTPPPGHAPPTSETPEVDPFMNQPPPGSHGPEGELPPALEPTIDGPIVDPFEPTTPPVTTPEPPSMPEPSTPVAVTEPTDPFEEQVEPLNSTLSGLLEPHTETGLVLPEEMFEDPFEIFTQTGTTDWRTETIRALK